MTVVITDTTNSAYAKSATFTCDKTAAYVSIGNDGRVNVCCRNASNRVWRGMGQFFSNMSEAMDAYKSSAMKAILSAAQAELAL